MSISNTAARTGNSIKNTQDFEFRRHDVDFPSCGVTLHGQLLVPNTEGPHAAIAMAPGMEEFTLTSNEARDWFTRHLVVGGSVALN
jgi:hypothetical protein